MKLLSLGIVAIVIAGVAGWTYWQSTTNSVSVDTKSNTVREETRSLTDTAVTKPVKVLFEEAENTPASLSLQAFAAKEFNGHSFQVGEVLARSDAYTRYFITYKSGDLTISGIMNVPTGEGPFPVLFLNHGYIDPAVYTNGRGLKREQDYLARQGYIVVHSDYRNHAQSDKDPNTELNFRLGYAEDVINGIKAMQASNLPYFDKERVGMLGHSMGGGVAEVIMVTQFDLVDAVVLFAPVSADFRDNFNKWTRSRPQVAEQIIARYGTAAENPEFWDNISPIHFLDSVTVPVMVHHGTNDESVPLEWSERLADALEKEGKNVAFHIYPNEPHEFAAAWPIVMQRTTIFFDSHLK